MGEESKILQSNSLNSSDATGFLEAWRLPGVALFALCLFFSKLVAYTFLYWMPFYIRHTAVAGVHFSHKTADILSTIFDIGAVGGGVLAGYISDKIEARAVTSFAFLLLSIFALVLYRMYGSISMFANIFLMFVSGSLVNGPYALIPTAVAADLSCWRIFVSISDCDCNHRWHWLCRSSSQLGSCWLPVHQGSNSMFAMLIVSVFIAQLFLIGIVWSEIEEKRRQKEWFWQNT